MDLNFKEKVAVVTGGSRGIGKAIAHAFLREGAKLSLIARNGDALADAARDMGDSIHFEAGDVTKAVDCEQLVRAVLQRWGRIDMLVCNVGNGSGSPPGLETPEEWRAAFDINLCATTNMVQATLPALERSSGTIVCISSICGLRTLGAPIPYAAAKAALHSYVQGMARPLAECGIRINAIAPGNILFPGGTWERHLAKDEKSVTAMLQSKVPLKRFGTPEEIADFCLFLASKRTTFCTGGIFVVDGGQTA